MKGGKMRLKDFLSTYSIKSPEFADAIGISTTRLRPYIYNTRKPPIWLLRRIIVQTGYQVTLEDFIDDLEDDNWQPRKLASTAKTIVGGLDTTKMRKHERKKYFDDIEII